MTREEEIKQELKRRKQIGSDNPIRNNSFLLGALWADAHPVNPWHKVSEELPKETGWYFCITSAHACGVALYDDENKVIEVIWAQWGRDSDTVTHWMPIPKIWGVEK